MKWHIVAVSCIISALLVVSCGKSGGDALPRTVYSSSGDGVILRSAPDDKSGDMALVPFGCQLKLIEKSGNSGDTLWYKTGWNGVEGWVKGDSVSDKEAFIGIIKKSIESDMGFISEGNRKFFSIDSPDKIRRYTYTGGEMEPASMIFLTGGGMILNSKIFDEKYTSHYFTCEFLNEGRLLKLTFADSRLNFSDYAEVENGSASVFKIDNNEGSITYHVKGNAFYFMNWGFVRDDKF